MLIQITKDNTPPVSLEELKEHLRILDTDSDDYIEATASAAVDYVERVTGRDYSDAVYEETYWSFPCSKEPIRLLKPGTVSAITYYDSANVEHTWSTEEYLTVESLSLTLVYPQYGISYPRTCRRPDAVKIRYAVAADDSERMKHAVKLLVAHWYSNREAEVIGTISSELKIGLKNLIHSLKLPSYR